ncbi:MAG: CoA transferase [Deltaproteobacteria bacterium]|nr:CoA transferase [Deltaproteobacteria bacterium]
MAEPRTAPQALDGVRVLELAGAEGEYCGKLLADFGAEVIKVEPPEGSPSRHEPPFKDDRPGSDRSLPFLYFNANKKSITADLGTEEGRERVRSVSTEVDVLLESGAPGTLAALGLGYEDLRTANPGLVYASVTAFGQTGPYSGYRWSGLVAFAMGGLMYVSGKPSAPPVNAPGAQAFLVGSAHAALAILMALWRVRRGGAGQHVDVSMMDCLAAMENMVSRSASTGVHPRRDGTQHRFATPGTIYRCRDGYVHIFVTNSQPGAWDRFVDWLGLPEALTGDEFGDPVYRRAHVAEVDQVVSAILANLPKEKVYEELQDRHIPCAPVNTPLEFVRDRHIESRGFVVDTVHPRLGPMAFPGRAYKTESWRFRHHAPAVGEHEEVVLNGFGAAPDSPRKGSAAPDSESDQAPRTAAGPADRTALNRLPLTGIRVADFTHMVAGPYGTMQLAYFGAEVIKIESRARPDTWRIREGNKDVEASLPFADHNRNKLSVTANLKTAEGRELARRIIAESDVVVENFSVGVMDRLGLGYEELRALKPDIIMIRLQGLGTTGPRKNYVTWGPSLMPFSGMTWLWNHPDGGAPVGSQTSYPDYIVSIHMAFALMAALHHRANTGEGQFIDIAQGEVTASLIGPALLDGLVNGRAAEPVGNRGHAGVPHGCYPCAGEDEWCVISVGDDAEWQRLCAATENGTGLRDERFATAAGRRANAAELDELVSEWTRQRSPREVMEALQAQDVTAGMVSDGTTLVHDPHLRSRDAVVEHDHPRQGRLTLPGIVMKLSGTPGEIRRHAPLLGQDTHAVLSGLLGLTDEEIRRLEAAGAF